jgi:hypothetical protein
MPPANDRTARIGVQLRRVHSSLFHFEPPTAQPVPYFTATESLNTLRRVR